MPQSRFTNRAYIQVTSICKSENPERAIPIGVMMTIYRSRLALVQIGVVAAGLALSTNPLIAGQSSSDWTGGYLGGFLGYDHASDDWRTGSNAGTTAASPEDFIGGLEIGANYQVSLFVVGIEGDLSLLPLWLGRWAFPEDRASRSVRSNLSDLRR